MANGTMIFRQWPQIVGLEEPRKWQTRRVVPDSAEILTSSEDCILIVNHKTKWWVGQTLTIMSKRGGPAIWRWWSAGNDDGEPRGTLHSVGDESPYGEGERAFVTITALRIERLQDITEADAIAEGVKDIAAYRELFASINGPKAWEKNPRVAVISFKYEE